MGDVRVGLRCATAVRPPRPSALDQGWGRASCASAGRPRMSGRAREATRCAARAGTGPATAPTRRTGFVRRTSAATGASRPQQVRGDAGRKRTREAGRPADRAPVARVPRNAAPPPTRRGGACEPRSAHATRESGMGRTGAGVEVGVRTEVVVIGAGQAGLSAASGLARAGADVRRPRRRGGARRGVAAPLAHPAASTTPTASTTSPACTSTPPTRRGPRPRSCRSTSRDYEREFGLAVERPVHVLGVHDAEPDLRVETDRGTWTPAR